MQINQIVAKKKLEYVNCGKLLNAVRNPFYIDRYKNSAGMTTNDIEMIPSCNSMVHKSNILVSISYFTEISNYQNDII